MLRGEHLGAYPGHVEAVEEVLDAVLSGGVDVVRLGELNHALGRYVVVQWESFWLGIWLELSFGL